MQPPIMRAHVLDHFESLRARIDRDRTDHDARRALEATERAKKHRRDIDYVAAIAAWFESIPPAMRNRRYLMTEFVERFPGRYRYRAHVAQLGPALRQLGWTPKRDWTAAGRNARYWLPPTE